MFDVGRIDPDSHRVRDLIADFARASLRALRAMWRGRLLREPHRVAVPVVLVVLAGCTGASALAPDGLPSWNDGPTRQAIVQFVAAVTREGSPDFVAPAERVA